MGHLPFQLYIFAHFFCIFFAVKRMENNAECVRNALLDCQSLLLKISPRL